MKELNKEQEDYILEAGLERWRNKKNKNIPTNIEIFSVNDLN